MGHQYFAYKILQIVISDEKWPPLIALRISHNIVGISKSSKQHLRT
jgi:hypothetical protein